MIVPLPYQKTGLGCLHENWLPAAGGTVQVRFHPPLHEPAASHIAQMTEIPALTAGAEEMLAELATVCLLERTGGADAAAPTSGNADILMHSEHDDSRWPHLGFCFGDQSRHPGASHINLETERQAAFPVATVDEMPLSGGQGTSAHTLGNIRVVLQIPFLIDLDRKGQTALKVAVINEMSAGR